MSFEDVFRSFPRRSCRLAAPLCCVRNKTCPPPLHGPKRTVEATTTAMGRETRFFDSEFNFVVDKHTYNKKAKRRNRLYRRRKNWVSNKGTLMARRWMGRDGGRNLYVHTLIHVYINKYMRIYIGIYMYVYVCTAPRKWENNKPSVTRVNERKITRLSSFYYRMFY